MSEFDTKSESAAVAACVLGYISIHIVYVVAMVMVSVGVYAAETR